MSRAATLQRFRYDDDALVRGVLRDLVDTGLIYATGRGEGTRYRAAEADPNADAEAIEALAWVTIYHAGDIARASLEERLRLVPRRMDAALATLIADDRVTFDPATAHYTCAECALLSLTAILMAGCREPTPVDVGLSDTDAASHPDEPVR